MKVKERIKAYKKIIDNNGYIIRIYNNLICLEQNGLVDSQAYQLSIDLIKRLKNDNEKLFKAYPLTDKAIDFYSRLLIREPNIVYSEDATDNDLYKNAISVYKDDDDLSNEEYEKSSYEFDDEDDESYGGTATMARDNEWTKNIKNIGNDDQFISDEEDEESYDIDYLDEFDDNDENMEDNLIPEFNIEYKLDPKIEIETRYKNDVRWYALEKMEINKNKLYEERRVYILGSYLKRDLAIEKLYKNDKSMSIEEAEDKIDEKLIEQLSNSSYIKEYYNLSLKALVDYYERGFFCHSTMFYLLNSIKKVNQKNIKDILIARKYKLIAENRCLEDAFLKNPKRFINVQAFKKPLQYLYNSEYTRKLCFNNWEELYIEKIHALENGFYFYLNCIDDEECIAHNINTKAYLQAYTSMLFDKNDLNKVNKERSKLVKDVKEEYLKKIVLDSKVLKRTIILSEN